MAKTKRTAEDVNVVAAASSDSKLVTQGGLNRFATKFWDKIKNKYDRTFNEVSLSAGTSTDKKLTFTRVNGTPEEVDLSDYVRLQDKNAFKQDVSVNDAETKSNLSVGTKAGTVDPSQRSLGARNLSSRLFTDGYVSKFRVYLDNAYQQPQVAIHVWAIKKGATKSDDRTAKAKMYNGERITVDSGDNKKWIDIPINEAFANDTYFVFRTGASVNVEAISNIANAEDVVNLNDHTPPDVADRPLDFSGQRTDKTAYVEIFGRMGIVDLNKKIEKVSADSSLYVKHSETTDTGGVAEKAGKVVKLDNDGKLNKNMLPSIAINEYFEITEFTDAGLRDKTYENGDVVVVNNSTNSNHGKKYLCIKKDKNASTNSTSDFIELNSKDGSVLSVNEKTGAITLALEAAADKLKLKITGAGGTTDAETSVPIITNDEIDSIIDGLQ
nr:MAG TPA: hypothetical protein [Bacteriophage sp.]